MKRYPIKFKIYPENKSLYYVVYIFDKKKDMYDFNDKAFKEGYSACKSRRFEAQCSYSQHLLCDEDDKCKLQPQLGEILFYKNSFNQGGIVSHEMTHAVNYYLFARKKINPTEWEEWDERHAWIQGNLVAQYWNHYYKKFV